MRKSDLVIVGIVVGSFVINCIALPFMPAEIATHWNRRGVPDGFMEKTFGLFMLSAILAIIGAVFIAIPRIEQAKTKMKKIFPFYYLFSIWFMSMLLFVNLHVVLWNMDIMKLNPLTVISASLVLLMPGVIFLFFVPKANT